MRARAFRITRSRLVMGAITIAVVLAAVASTHFSTQAAEGAQDAASSRDAAADFKDEIVPAIAKHATPINVLLPALVADKALASKQYGVENSSGTTYFSTTLSGVISSVADNGQLKVTVDGVSTPIVVQTGPVIGGSVLRDGTGLIDFNQFKNQIDFLRYSTALNKILADQLAPVKPTLVAGAPVKITGAFPYAAAGVTVMITPTSIELAR